MIMVEYPAEAELKSRIAPTLDWREVVTKVKDLPSMPAIAAQAMQVIDDPHCSISKIINLINSDTALAARVLRIANSAMFAKRAEVKTLLQAITMIGMRALKGVVVAGALLQLKTRAKIAATIWEKSVATAIFGHAIAKMVKPEVAEEAFLLGLLHNLGQLAMVSELGKDYEKVFEEIEIAQCNYLEAEYRLFGYSHNIIGSLLAKKWNFPAETGRLLFTYKDKPEGVKAENITDLMTAIVNLAEALTHQVGLGVMLGYPDESQEIIGLLGYIGLTPDLEAPSIVDLINQTKQQISSEIHLYN